MLALPKWGFGRSVEAHNVHLDVLADWIEGTALFTCENGEEFSKATVVDALHEAQIYESQEFAWQRVADAWSELRRRRVATANAYPFAIDDNTIARLSDWREVPAHSFCLALSFAKWFPDWAKTFGRNFTEQGELFELLTRQALEALFNGWKFQLTGWARSRTDRLKQVVSDIAGLLGEQVGNVPRWTRPNANDAGLDVLCYRPFPDGRVGVPVYLLQCASGRDWDGKLHTPNLDTWRNIVNFASMPKKAFATPFAFLDADFIVNCGVVNGLLLDRCRLLAAGAADPNWLSADVAARIVAWLEPRVMVLPMANQVL